MKSYCLPSLLYSNCCKTWHARSDDIRSANIALNNSFRKMFNSFWRESVKPVTDVLLVLTSLCFNTPTSFVVLDKMCIFRWSRFKNTCIVLSWCCRRCVWFAWIDYTRPLSYCLCILWNSLSGTAFRGRSIPRLGYLMLCVCFSVFLFFFFCLTDCEWCVLFYSFNCALSVQ